MGQGYSHTTLPAGPSAIEAPELSDLTFEKVLGGARFLRTVRAQHKNGIVVAKVCMKSSSTVSFKKYARILKEERRALLDVSNVLTFQRILETSNYGILVRQYIHTSLYDRISIRPFLETIEKKWIAFQLICAVRDCHSRGIFHGDIKTENVLVTSWGWVFLTDFSSAFKPVYLPEDNPADFSFYFDTSARRTCYLAPERFLAANQKPIDDVVQWNMDIFSIGCVIAELFTEAPTFTLSQLFKYRKGEYDPTVQLLNKIDDEHMRSLIASMIRRDPEERWHAQDYLDEHKGKAFPIYFYQHLHTLMEEITAPGPRQKDTLATDVNNGIADDRIERIYNDYEMLSVSLGYPQPQIEHENKQTLFPLQIDLPNARHTASASYQGNSDDGTLILLNVITASIRNVARASSKLHACELLLAFSERLADEAKLDRVLPYIMPLLEDTDEMVLVTALRSMTQLLALVKVSSPVNSSLFIQYIFPRLQAFVNTVYFRKYPTVRATYAACLATLAETASNFLTMIQALRADGPLSSADNGVEDEDQSAQSSYDTTRAELVEQFEAQTKVFLTDNDTAVRRAFLSSVTSLCVFFGEAKANDVILSHLNTYLNDSDWLLKCAFFKTIVGISVYVGGASIEDFILPLMLQALADPQDFVVEQALRSLASMAELGLLQRPKTWEMIDSVARFTMHPNLWIREAAAHFISAAVTWLSVADVRILVMPLIAPYLKVPIATLSETELLDALKKPIPRTVLDLALSWATRVDKGVFWKSAKESRHLAYQGVAQIPLHSSVVDLTKQRALAKVPKNDEDEQYLNRLRSAGMRDEDEFKLLAFREYIWRASHRKDGNDVNGKTIYDDIVKLAKLKIRPQTILFDNEPSTYTDRIEGDVERLPPPSINTTAIGSDRASSVDTTSTLPVANLTLRNRTTDSLASSPSSGIGLMKDVDRTLRNRESRAQLLAGGPGNKAMAEVATNDATASGKLQTAPVDEIKAKRPSTLNQTTSTRSIHNYTGQDPNVLKMLDNVYVDNFPIDVAEFGPIIQPGERGPIQSNAGSVAQKGLWRPQGRLVAILSEHSARVSKLVVSPDHHFFLSASDDATVKVWDSERLEKNISHRSRATYRLATGIKVTSICFIESTHTFACTGDDGSVHVVKVDLQEGGKDSSHATRYGKLKTLREWKIPSASNEHAVALEHLRQDGANILVIATNMNSILAVDLRRMDVLYRFTNSAQHGAISCFCIGRKQDWLLIGTTHGMLDLWDLRFRLKLRSWSFTNFAPISSIQLHPSRKAARRNRVCISGGTHRGEVSIWDIEKGICTDVLRTMDLAAEKVSLRHYELQNLDDEQHNGSLLGKDQSSAIDEEIDAEAKTTAAFLGLQTSPKDAEVQYPFIVTGGPDNRVRFWSLDFIESCGIVSGSSQDEKPIYTLSNIGLDTKVISEKVPSNATTEAVESPKGQSTPKRGQRGSNAVESSNISSPSRAGAIESNKIQSPSTKREKSTVQWPTRYEQIRTASRQLLSGHLDTITDIAMLERPFGMIVSADRSGQIFVHQ